MPARRAPNDRQRKTVGPPSAALDSERKRSSRHRRGRRSPRPADGRLSRHAPVYFGPKGRYLGSAATHDAKSLPRRNDTSWVIRGRAEHPRGRSNPGRYPVPATPICIGSVCSGSRAGYALDRSDTASGARGRGDHEISSFPKQLAARVRKWKQRFARHAKGLANAWRDSATLAREHRLSRVRMLSEAAPLVVQGRMGVNTYFHYRFFDPSSRRKPSGSTSPRRPARTASSGRSSLRAATAASSIKALFNRYFTSFGLPLARISA